ncbi:MAG TPA: preprotein translocase subunit YajC [Bryobacterales bacterium]|nr:preprotein translocase subunit YajC [Bryobacterales bacterium]
MGELTLFEETIKAGSGMAGAFLWLQESPFATPFAPIILMVVIFYLVLFLPMRRRQKKTDDMLRNLKNGDRVVTGGGIVGTIVTLGENDNTVTIRVKPDNVKLQFSRSAVSGLIAEEEEK